MSFQACLRIRGRVLNTSRFYYADERKADGSPKYRINGDAHAKLYLDLATTETQRPWMQTFVQGEGYKEFHNLYQA